jgi:hypothetical protein
MSDLQNKGYEFKFNADGYSVKHDGIFLGGASVKLPRKKRLHWRHKAANVKDNLEQCLLTVERTKKYQTT